MADCVIERWLTQRLGDLRGFIRETDDAQTLRLLQQVRDDFEASRRRHREACPQCFGWPTYGDLADLADNPGLAESLGADLGEVIRYKSNAAPSRREATRCRCRH